MRATIVRATIVVAVAAALVGLAVPTVAAATDPATVGMADPATGLWYLRDVNGNSNVFYFGDPGDVPFVGDWDCDAIDTPGLYRQSDGFVYLRNSNSAGTADIRFFFGDTGDVPLAGDFDGDGCDTVSIYRPQKSQAFIHNSLGAHDGGLGAAEFAYTFGNPGDDPFVGDFDGDGIDDLGLHRATTGLVYFRLTHSAGPADRSFTYGDPADRIVAADWTGIGTGTVAIFRPGDIRFYINHANRSGAADEVLPYGYAGWLPLAGNFGPPAPPSGKDLLVVRAVGDTNLSTSYIPNLALFGHSYAWEGTPGLFTEDDLTIVNLECAASNLGSPLPKTFSFRCDVAGLAPMRQAGVEVANLANNHSGDMGIAAMIDSRAVVQSAGIAAVGVGGNEAQAEAPAVLEVNGWKIAVLGFNGVAVTGVQYAGPSSPGMADGRTAANMTAAVRSADEVADLVFVTVHWGRERDLFPRSGEVARGRAMVDAGADAIFGHHSHRLNPLDTYRGRPIAWSLGNWIWTSHSPDGNVTAVAEVIVQPDGLITSRLIPARIVDNGRVVLVD